MTGGVHVEVSSYIRGVSFLTAQEGLQKWMRKICDNFAYPPYCATAKFCGPPIRMILRPSPIESR